MISIETSNFKQIFTMILFLWKITPVYQNLNCSPRFHFVNYNQILIESK